MAKRFLLVTVYTRICDQNKFLHAEKLSKQDFIDNIFFSAISAPQRAFFKIVYPSNAATWLSKWASRVSILHPRYPIRT
jgi:hypothetical protein